MKVPKSKACGLCKYFFGKNKTNLGMCGNTERVTRWDVCRASSCICSGLFFLPKDVAEQKTENNTTKLYRLCDSLKVKLHLIHLGIVKLNKRNISANNEIEEILSTIKELITQDNDAE